MPQCRVHGFAPVRGRNSQQAEDWPQGPTYRPCDPVEPVAPLEGRTVPLIQKPGALPVRASPGEKWGSAPPPDSSA